MENLKVTVLTALQTASALSAMTGFYFQYPPSFTSFPMLSYFQLDNIETLPADDIELGSEIIFQIDLWGKASLSTLSIGVSDVMQTLGFQRLSAQDMYETDTKIYHIPMRFNIHVSDPDF
ncbi:MAG: hypothetical protein PHO15_00410 [Eubacteriales bacterium]|nr:hypothetical protein [Eubacteriales bacterium]